MIFDQIIPEYNGRIILEAADSIDGIKKSKGQVTLIALTFPAGSAKMGNMEQTMGTLTEEITLENSIDRTLAELGQLKNTEIRSLKVEAMPDTGAWTLVINEDVREKLGLNIEGKSHSTLADGTATNYPLTKPVTIQWKNRSTTLPAVVVADAKEVLLGVLPLEAMDLLVDPVRKTLAGAHGDQPLHVLY